MHTLITGADGLVGLHVARELLATTDDTLHLWVHARDQADVDARRARTLPLLGGTARRVHWYGGDLTDATPLAGVPAGLIDGIVHCAAVTRFGVDRGAAEQVNVLGTARVLAFARHCPRLVSLVLASTLYASGLRAGHVPEEASPAGYGFANHYEWSKWAAEQLALRDHVDLPVRVARLATLIADDETGRVSRQGAFHHTLRLLHLGLLGVVPGRPEVPLHLVTGAFAGRALARLLRDRDARGVYHLTPAADQAVTLGRLLEIAFERFEQDELFRRRRVPRPVWADPEVFTAFADDAQVLGGDVVRHALASMAPFARQLAVAKEPCTDRARTALPDLEPAAPEPLAVRVCDQLVRTSWGRHASA